MHIQTRSTTVTWQISRTTRAEASDTDQNLIQSYLPPDKAEKYTSYSALQDDTRAWQSSLRTRGLYEADLTRLDKAGNDYLPILQKAMDNGGFSDPKGFLKSLSSDELQKLQYAHGLADPINVDKLSEEGALNLLLPPNDAKMDIDGDGFVSVGDGRTFVFPPANAPKEVDEAWKQATAGLDDQARSMLEMTMHLASPPPGDSETADPIASFRDIVKNALQGLEISRQFENEDQRALTDKLSEVLKTFDKTLTANQA